MKKKQLLATLVMLSLMQGSVYAADYDNKDNVTGDEINFDQMVVGNKSPNNILIGNEDGSTQTITIGKDNLGKYDCALQINDMFTAGTKPHNVTLNGKNININAGEGLGISIGSSYEKGGYSSLTIKGEKFTYTGDGNGGITVAHGSFYAGDENNWLDEFKIEGGNLSIGVQPAYEVGSEIYAKTITITNNEKGRGNAFDGDGYSNINAESITLEGSFETGSASTGKSGVLTFGKGSNNNFTANVITITAKKNNEKANEYLYAIKSNTGSKDTAYTLNINAGNLLDIQGNVLLDGKGTATFTGQTVRIVGDMLGEKNEERSALTLNNGSQLNIGTDDNKADNIVIESKGQYGVLLGGPNDSQNTSENGVLNANANNSFKITAPNGTGLAALRDTSNADIKSGVMYVKAGKDGIVADVGSIKAAADKIDENLSYGILIDAAERGIYTNGSTTRNVNDYSGKVELTSTGGNIIVQSQKSAIEALNNSTVTLTAEGTDNDITLWAQGTNEDKAAVFAEGNIPFNGTVHYQPTVDLTAENGTVNIYSKDKSVVASGKGGTININGAVNINANYMGNSTNLMADDENKYHIALAAGGTSIAESLKNENYGEINVNLKGTQNSYITGDIVGARDGIVNIRRDENYSGILKINGDILAGNGGTREDESVNKVIVGAVNVDLGNGGQLTGRIDDYQDADIKKEHEFFDPHFTDGEVTKSGTVNLKMGEGSEWKVTGQSWVTKLEGKQGEIDLTADDGETHAVHIGELTGKNTFVVDLNADDHGISDMLYIGKGTNEQQTLLINNERSVLEQLDPNERLRFATVAEAGGGFGDNYVVKGRGIRNVDLDIEYVNYNDITEKDKDENDSYNNASFGEEKPGTDYVDKNYGNGQNSKNVYLVRSGNPNNPGGSLTDSAKTIINMSRANYKNAIYMDRLNKRFGEARYINPEDGQGMWVRLRHDRIGQSGEFRSMNSMYELGYDVKQNCDNGSRRVGMAIDYMKGSTSYDDILGKGETKRYGLWLYDTWLGDKGHYADYVLKWGHLSNDFDIRDKDSFDHVVGDYSNNVFSVSAEYGKKNDMGSSWYFEPQAQLQLARLTRADYTTETQDTKVSVEGINSLIGRVGFRLGRDVDERRTVYVKADLLHEFLGEQTITASDVTGTMSETFENKGTWYDVGLGFATAIGKSSYAFMDFEKSFGNDNDETYQINAGVQWTF